MSLFVYRLYSLLKYVFLHSLFLTFLHSGDLSYTPTHPQRPPGGLSLGVGYQRELQLPGWLWAVLPCCAHLHRKWNLERRPASVLAWVTSLYLNDNYNGNYRGLSRKSPYVNTEIVLVTFLSQTETWLFAQWVKLNYSSWYPFKHYQGCEMLNTQLSGLLLLFLMFLIFLNSC